ncbi:MAG: 5'-3' exonuclease H3TH domain-containing protein [Rhodospirillaceae bacterium]
MLISRTAPPWLDDESALVIVDWSWWLNKAFRIGGIDGMTSSVIGWLTSHVLADHPAHLALALDATGETHRHRREHPTDPGWRYKAGRDPKPADFYTIAERCTQIAELHAIPVLWADRYEADDVIATATAKARAAGYRVWICSADKDLHALVSDDPKSGVTVGTWDNFEGTWRGPEEVRTHYGVEPAQMADFLAIWGDSGDNIPGAEGLGKIAAADILRAWGDLESALAAPVYTPENFAAAEGHAKALAKRIKITSDPDARAKLEAERAEVMRVRKLAKAHHVLVQHADLVRFSRTLTALDCDAPVRMPWNDLPVGGFHAAELRQRYLDLGYTQKAQQVPSFPKRAPWCVPYEDDTAAA